jgi:hypothetical protein
MPLTGSCNCEAISVTIKDAGLQNAQPGYCHCSNCRRQSGSRGSYVMLVDDDNLEISGTPKAYLDAKTDSGTPLHRNFCGECGSPITSVTPLAPGKSFVKMGLFKEIPAPVVECYTKNRDKWEPAMPGTAQFEGSPGA